MVLNVYHGNPQYGYYFNTKFPIYKTMTKESKQMKTKRFNFVVTLRRAVLIGFTKSHFKF